MSITINLDQAFEEYTGHQTAVAVEGKTVRECLSSLIVGFPALKNLIFTPQNEMAVLVVLNKTALLPGDLDKPIADSSELLLLPLIYGG
jgi:molybdopterin converting factor small subunit